MRRYRELLEGDLAWSPVRLLGGFICVDFHLGCAGCAFCLNRRQPEWHAFLDRGLHLDLDRCGISLEDLFALIASLPSFSLARVPLRCGHLTDWRYQNRSTRAFFDLLPPDYPCVVMTRYPLNAEQAAWIRGQPNLLVHVSLSPPVPRCEKDHVPPELVIESTRRVPAENLFFMCRPLPAGQERAARALVEALPEGAAVGFHGLSTDSIPGLAGLRSPSDEAMTALRAHAQELGLRVLDYFGCVLRARLRRPFFRYVEASRRPGTACAGCGNARTCAAPGPPLDEARVREALGRLMIDAAHLEICGRSVAVRTPSSTSRAEEVYLSELLCAEVSLSTVTRGEAPGIRLLGPSVLERWDSCGFAPVPMLRELSALVRRAILQTEGGSCRAERNHTASIVGGARAR